MLLPTIGKKELKAKSRIIVIAVALISMLSLCFIGTAFAYNAVKGANKSNKIELLSNNNGEAFYR